MANSNIAAFPYYGGKHRLSKKIVPIIESIPHKVYVEPCCGGASVFFRRKPDPKRVDVLNDINKDVYAVYRAFQLYPDEMIREIQSMPYSEALYQECKEIRSSIFSLEPRDLVLRGAASYFHICNSYANITTPKRLNFSRDAASNLPRRWQTRWDLLSYIQNRVLTVHLDCSDIIACITRWDSPDALFYIDPPYVDTDCSGYSGNIDYDALCKLLTQIEGTYILSGYAGAILNSLTLKTPINGALTGGLAPEQLTIGSGQYMPYLRYILHDQFDCA